MKSADDRRSGFDALGDVSLAPLGITGQRIAIFCIDDALSLCCDAGVTREITPAQVERLRFGLVRTRHDSYHVARLFLTGEASPLLLMPASPRDPAFATTMRRFAHAVAETGGIGRIERGLTTAGALINLALVGAVTIGASLMALFVWDAEFGSTASWLFVAVMIAVLAVFFWQAMRHELPRPLVSLNQLDAYLPR